MNILVIGIPDLTLIDVIQKKYSQVKTIFVTETRPFEQEVADALEQCADTSLEYILITDNMIGALIQSNQISALYVQVAQHDSESLQIIAGGAIGIIAARQHGIPFYRYEGDIKSRQCDCFFGHSIIPLGVSHLNYQNDSYNQICAKVMAGDTE